MEVEDEIASDNDSLLDDDEANEDQEACDKSPSLSSIQDVFSKVYTDFNKKFSCITSNVKHGLDLMLDKSKKVLKLNVEVDLEDGWLRHPNGEDAEDILKWDATELEVKSAYNWVPKDFKSKNPKRLPVKIVDSEKEKFLMGKQLLKPGKKLSLPTNIFSPNSVTIHDKKLCYFELWGRQGIIESEITHNLLDLNQDIIGCLSNLFDTLEISSEEEKVKAIKENFKNLMYINTLAMQSNFRGKNHASATCVSAKLGLRELVLEKYEDDPTVKEHLLCSSFGTDTLFGPIPKSMSEIPPNCAGKTSLLKAKNSFVGGKRKINTKPADTRPKRGRFDYSMNHYAKPLNEGNYGNYVPKYASNSLFPKDRRGNFKGRGGKRGSKS